MKNRLWSILFDNFKLIMWMHSYNTNATWVERKMKKALSSYYVDGIVEMTKTKNDAINYVREKRSNRLGIVEKSVYFRIKAHHEDLERLLK